MRRISAIEFVAIWRLRTLLASRGEPGGSSLSFASPKESNQRKGDPAVCDPSLRFGYLAVLSPVGVSHKLGYRLKQVRSLIRLAFRSSAHTEGVGREGLKSESGFISLALPGWAEERRAKRIRARACLSEASLHVTPLGSSTARCPKRSAGTQTAGRLFFCLLCFWRSKRKVSCRRATPGNLRKKITSRQSAFWKILL
jgi:hypothetical protein